MDIEFIKWMVEKAENFEMENDVVLWGDCRGFDLLIIKGSIAYPLLLQGAIEGVNKGSYFGNGQIELIQHRWGIQIKDYSTDNHDIKAFRFESYENYKETALMFVWDINNAK